nr:transglutaminase domain-containing protein [Deltaproteobacteria bacterium]
TAVAGARAIPIEIRFPPFDAGRDGVVPHAVFPTLMRSNDGNRALRRSAFARTWALAKRLKRDTETPYAYVLEVNRYLQDGFTYDEDPGEIAPGRAKLDGFLFDTRTGYCQYFSGAMALLLRMGGIPARVVTGFSPGGYSKSKRAWIVRDTDAHSWVEAWFDDWGWVTFDPTPAGTPARSQIAALERAAEVGSDSGDAASDSAGSAPRTGGVRPDLLGGAQSGPGGAGESGGSSDDGGGGNVPWRVWPVRGAGCERGRIANACWSAASRGRGLVRASNACTSASPSGFAGASLERSYAGGPCRPSETRRSSPSGRSFAWIRTWSLSGDAGPVPGAVDRVGLPPHDSVKNGSTVATATRRANSE